MDETSPDDTGHAETNGDSEGTTGSEGRSRHSRAEDMHKERATHAKISKGLHTQVENFISCVGHLC